MQAEGQGFDPPILHVVNDSANRAVVKEALDAIKDGKPRLLDFGVTDEQAWDVGLACGGKVQVFVEKVN